MVFTSAIFIFMFLPITLLGYYLVPKNFKNIWLFFVSIIFYSWSGVYYAILFLFSAYMNYLFGIWMERTNKRKKVLVISLFWNLGLLGFFKYFTFI